MKKNIFNTIIWITFLIAIYELNRMAMEVARDDQLEFYKKVIDAIQEQQAEKIPVQPEAQDS